MANITIKNLTELEDRLTRMIHSRANEDRTAILSAVNMRADSASAGVQTIIAISRKQHEVMSHDMRVLAQHSIGLTDKLNDSFASMMNAFNHIDEQLTTLEDHITLKAATSDRQHQALQKLILQLGEQIDAMTAGGRSEPQSMSQPDTAGDGPDLNNPTVAGMAHIVHLIQELQLDNKRIRYDIGYHVEKQHKFNQVMNDRIRNLEILVNSNDDELALLKGRIKLLESKNEPQTDDLPERRGETETPETPVSVPAGYRVERVAYNIGNIVEVAQRWLDSTPEFFQHTAGSVMPVPTELRRFSDWATIEFALLSAAERLRRHRTENLKSQLGAFGPSSHSYPRLKIQRENAFKESDKG